MGYPFQFLSLVDWLINQFNDQLLIEFDQWMDGEWDKERTAWLASWTDESFNYFKSNNFLSVQLNLDYPNHLTNQFRPGKKVWHLLLCVQVTATMFKWLKWTFNNITCILNIGQEKHLHNTKRKETMVVAHQKVLHCINHQGH